MSVQTQPRISPAEYLAAERAGDTKHEYLAGEVFAMVGASRQHVRIVTNLVRELSLQLKGRPCQVYASDLRVLVEAADLYTYPDVVVVCGEERLSDHHFDTLLNPTVVFEVLSPSTEAYDRGEKFAHYRRLESLTDYLLVSQTRRRIEHFHRESDGRWTLAEAAGPEAALDVPSIGCRLALAEVYDKVERDATAG
jgi:Uma2 family endonuclease